jgi:hypothetical protein
MDRIRDRRPLSPSKRHRPATRVFQAAPERKTHRVKEFLLHLLFAESRISHIGLTE